MRGASGLVAGSHMFNAPQDIIFYIFFSSDHNFVLDMLQRSAQRISQYTGSSTAYALIREAEKSMELARAVFTVFVMLDTHLRSEVTTGCTHKGITFKPMCQYKAASFFTVLKVHVIDPWIEHEANTPSMLVKSFRDNYLAS